MVQKAYKFRLYPNKEQREYFARTFGCVRFVYNRMLAEKIACYEETGKSLSVTPAKYKSEFVERFLELSLFYGLSSPLNSEMICIFPYF